MTAELFSDSDLARLFAPLEKYRHCGLAVSGGADSMALMHLAVRWRGPGSAQVPMLSVLTVDHCLREGSDAEAQFVADAAAALGLAHISLAWEGDKPASGIQAAARAARYDLMCAAARDHGIDCLVTAHHLGDQAETLLMRLKRGSGVDGLGAMALTGSWAGMPVVRPLLDVPSERLREWLESEGIRWVEDPSNADEGYERVRLRKAFRQLQSLGYSTEKLAETARRMRRASEALDHGAREFLSSHGVLHETGYCAIDVTGFAALPEEIAIRALKMTLEAVAGLPQPLSLSRLERLTQDMRAEQQKPRTFAGCRVVPREGTFLILREPGRKGLDEIQLSPGESAVWDRRIMVTASGGLDTPVTVRALGQEGYGEVRARLKEALNLPPGAGPTVASFWCKDTLLSAPQLGYHAGHTSEPLCSAQLLSAAPFASPLER